jgi:vacuolar-type H+-ATPase subunit F/Vma7
VTLPVFVGDEVEAAGFRLAGLSVRTPAVDELMEVLQWARANAPLVLISAATARRLPQAALENLLAGVTPPVVVVPDVHRETPTPDLASRLRQQLGVLE